MMWRRSATTIELRGPIGGHFVWSVGDGGPILLVGGGSGVVPLMSMVRHRAAQGNATPMLLLLSAARAEEVLYRDELLALDEKRDGFALALALTRETAFRAGDYSRRVDAAMLAESWRGCRRRRSASSCAARTVSSRRPRTRRDRCRARRRRSFARSVTAADPPRVN